VSYHNEQHGDQEKQSSASLSGNEKQETNARGAKEDRSESGSGQMGGYVYFLETEDQQYVKIGYSIHPQKRLLEIRAHNPGARLLGCIRGSLIVERKLHWQFQDERYDGEWFRYSSRLRQFIQDLEGFKPSPESEPESELPLYPECLRCGHKWLRRVEWLPKECPSCRQSEWNRPARWKKTAAKKAKKKA